MPVRPLSRALRALTLTVTLGAAAVASAWAGPSYSGLYVFGDSLSDNGNLFALTGGAVPPAPYVGGRFSNGAVAAEYLAADLGLSGALHDYAIAGALSGVDGQLAGTGLRSQVSGFTTAVGAGGADATGLYMVWAGANDFIHGDLSTPASRAAVVADVVGNLAASIGELYGAGARDFLLPLLPDLGATPRALAGGAAVSAGLTGLAAFTNSSLLAAYASLAGSLPDEHFTYFDTFAVQTETAGLFAAAGGNVTDTCLGAGAFPDCTGYYFFDDIHPTTATHQLLGDAMAAALPEPQTPALVLAGLLAAAAATRRTRRAQHAAQ